MCDFSSKIILTWTKTTHKCIIYSIGSQWHHLPLIHDLPFPCSVYLNSILILLSCNISRLSYQVFLFVLSRNLLPIWLISQLVVSYPISVNKKKTSNFRCIITSKVFIIALMCGWFKTCSSILSWYFFFFLFKIWYNNIN